MPCAFQGCVADPRLGSFYCAAHAQKEGSPDDYRMCAPPKVNYQSIPREGQQKRGPAEKEGKVFAAAALGAKKLIDGLLTTETAESARAIGTVFGNANKEKVLEVLKEMSQVLGDWAYNPGKCLTINEMNRFLGWAGGTSARSVGMTWLTTGYAPIELARVPDSAADLEYTLLHECAHGARKEIIDAAGYRHTHPTTFYRSSREDRLTNADHYATCVLLFQGKLSYDTWEADLKKYTTDDVAVIVPKLKSLVGDITRVVGNAKIQSDRLAKHWTAQGETLGIGQQNAQQMNEQLGGYVFDAGTKVKRASKRAVDVSGQLRRLERVLAGVDLGDGEIVDLEDIERGAVGGGAIVFPINAGNVKVALVADKTMADPQLRGLLLKGLLDACLNTAQEKRELSAKVVVNLYKAYNSGNSPIDIDPEVQDLSAM